MAINRMGLHAGISYDTTGAVITTNRAVGCSAVYNGAAGDSTLTLDRGLDITSMALLATIRGATIGSVSYANLTDTTKQLLCRDEAAGALAAGERPIDVLLININGIDRRFVQAAGHYNGALAGASVPYGQRGGVVVRAAAGVYTLTLDRGIAQRSSAILVTVGPAAGGATDLHARVVHTADPRVKTITIERLVDGNDIDADFSWAVFNMMEVPCLDAFGVGSIDAAGGNPVGRGCLPARNDAGDYRYAMDVQSATGDFLGLATPIGATGHAIRVVDAAVARKDVETQVQALAAQNNCDHAAVFVRLN